MEISVLSHVRGRGWTSGLPGHLDSEQTLVLAFGASSFLDDPAPLGELAAAFPRAVVLGCSTAGEILETKVSDETIAVAVARFEGTRLRAAVASVTSAADSRAAGARIAEELNAPDLRGVFIVSDGGCVNGSELVAGVNDRLPRDVVVTGGLAGDGDRFARTWIFADGTAGGGRVAAVGLYGDRVAIGHGSRGGWDLFGPERVVTRSSGNVLYELDGRPALELYKEYLGDLVSGLPSTALLFPLAIRSRDDERLVRTVLGIDEAAQSMIFAGDVPTGSHAQLMRANFDRLVQGASDAASMIDAGGAEKGATLSVAISCVGRRLVLRQRVEEEVEAALENMPPGTQQIGFYSYGELSPLVDGTCELHNQTMTLTTFAER